MDSGETHLLVSLLRMASFRSALLDGSRQFRPPPPHGGSPNTPDLGQQWRCWGRGVESPGHRGQRNSEGGSGEHKGVFFGGDVAGELDKDDLGEKPTPHMAGLGLLKGFSLSGPCIAHPHSNIIIASSIQPPRGQTLTVRTQAKPKLSHTPPWHQDPT